MSGLRIALLGAGEIGGTLGRKWAEAGHTVAFGVKNPASEKAQSLRAELGEHILIGSPAEALAKSDIVLLAVPGNAVKEVVAAHAELLDRKIIIDATNQLVKGQVEDFKQRRQRTMNSLSTLQTSAPSAQIYRAFNNYSLQVFAEPIYNGVQADLFYCGPEGESLHVIEQLISEIGLNPVRVGDLERIEIVDDVLLLWAALSFSQNGGSRKAALKMVTRERGFL